jgi:hypothetical protein
MKYQIDLDYLDEYIEVTADTFQHEGQFVVFFNFYRNLDGTVLEGAVTKMALFPVESINSIIAIPDED